MRALLIAIVLAVGSPSFALAQEQGYFANPFATPAAIRAARTATPDASVRYHYDVSRAERGGAMVTSQMTIDVATDWVLVCEGDRELLYDLRLNRTFDMNDGAHTFVSYNALATPGFLLSEYVNRGMLAGMMARAGVQAGQLADDCDAAAELGVIPPDAHLNAQLHEAVGVATAQCSGRSVGLIRLDGGAAPPPSLWPTLAQEMTSYPLLLEHARQSGHAPAQLETTFRVATNVITHRSFRLTATETVATPYPLTDAFRNATAAKVDEFMSGMGTLGADAVAGRAAGGPPTAQSWNQHLDEVARRDGLGAGGILMAPTANMFPEILSGACSADSAPLCAKLGGMRVIMQRDPAVLTVLQVAGLEQQHDGAGIIAAMRSLQSSPYRNHPVLGAEYGLALLWFDQNAMQQAQTAGLPTDPVPLEAAALALLPYNPAYWTDVGDRFLGEFEWQKAMAFYDVAFSLPMPSAVHDGMAMVSKREMATRIIHDAPDFFLQQ